MPGIRIFEGTRTQTSFQCCVVCFPAGLISSLIWFIFHYPVGLRRWSWTPLVSSGTARKWSHLGSIYLPPSLPHYWYNVPPPRAVICLSITIVRFPPVEVIAWYFPCHLCNCFTDMRYRYARSVINKPFRRYKGGRASKSLPPLCPLIILIHSHSSLTCHVCFANCFEVLPIERLFSRYGRLCIESFIYLINGYCYSSCRNHCRHIWLL